jgi:hypothetical protein
VKYSLNTRVRPTGGPYHGDGKQEAREKPRRHASIAQATVSHWTPKHTDCGLWCIAAFSASVVSFTRNSSSCPDIRAQPSGRSAPHMCAMLVSDGASLARAVRVFRVAKLSTFPYQFASHLDLRSWMGCLSKVTCIRVNPDKIRILKLNLARGYFDLRNGKRQDKKESYTVWSFVIYRHTFHAIFYFGDEIKKRIRLEKCRHTQNFSPRMWKKEAAWLTQE